jgi:hypothetical protein
MKMSQVRDILVGIDIDLVYWNGVDRVWIGEIQMSDTTIKSIQQQHEDRYRASQQAQMICNLLRDFIPHKCYRDAIDELTKHFDQHKVEFSTGEQRKVYEALQKNMLIGIDLGTENK